MGGKFYDAGFNIFNMGKTPVTDNISSIDPLSKTYCT